MLYQNLRIPENIIAIGFDSGPVESFSGSTLRWGHHPSGVAVGHPVPPFIRRLYVPGCNSQTGRSSVNLDNLVGATVRDVGWSRDVNIVVSFAPDDFDGTGGDSDVEGKGIRRNCQRSVHKQYAASLPEEASTAIERFARVWPAGVTAHPRVLS